MTLHHCGTNHQGDELAERRCAYRRAILDDLHAHAATLDNPPTAAQVADLWAHAQTITEDGGSASRWVRRVLDLGWRPSVGVGS